VSSQFGSSRISLQVNHLEHILDVPEDTALLYILRNDLALNGPKYGCGLGECGACAVLINGTAVRSCSIPVKAAIGKEITTLEGLGSQHNPHPVVEAFIQRQAAQCGYCLNGMIIGTVSLLKKIPQPSLTQIREALQHYLCRCGTHIEIMQAVQLASELLMQGQKDSAPPSTTTHPSNT
jgi:nicotinate dehydrogenase subunit A